MLCMLLSVCLASCTACRLFECSSESTGAAVVKDVAAALDDMHAMLRVSLIIYIYF